MEKAINYVILAIISGVMFYFIQFLYNTVKENKKMQSDLNRSLLKSDLTSFKQEIIQEVVTLLPPTVPAVRVAEQPREYFSVKNAFTDAELEIATLLVDQKNYKTYQDIATKRNTAVSTVNNQIETMKEKCGVRSKSELIVYLMRNEIV